MKWIEPRYSKEMVKKAGEYLVKLDVHTKEFQDSIPIFHNWRGAHAFPMQIMLDFLRKNTIRVDKHSIVVQRLKRVPSIYMKLVREKGMSLSRMEDIAGCRAIVDNSKYVERVCRSLKNSRTKNVLHRERDYISTPKESGYRGIHLVFKYNGSKSKYHGIPVEIQIRSKIQHSWATAVEIVGTFTKQALKASSGEELWLDFFKYASVEFAKLEKCTIDPRYNDVDTFGMLSRCVDDLGLAARLRAFNVAVNHMDLKSSKGAGYYVILLNLDQRTLNIKWFDKKSLREATDYYDKTEEKHKNDPNKDVVMVSAGSLKDLKRAYPNYFSDTNAFSKYLSKVYDNNGRKLDF